MRGFSRGTKCGAAALAVAFTALAGPAGASPAAEQPGPAAAPAGPVHVQSAVNGLNAADSGSDGAVLLQRPRGDEGRQLWTVEAADGVHRLHSVDDPGRCLGRAGGDAAVVACGDAASGWELTEADDGTHRLGVPGRTELLSVAAAAGGVHPERPVLDGDGERARWYLTPRPLPRAPMPGTGERTLDDMTFLTAHNAYANGVDGGFAPPFVNAFPNQTRGLRQQLSDGVRGFMLDVHRTADGAIMCHNSCTLVTRPVALWVGIQQIVDHLRQHPGEFATVFLEDYVPASLLRDELARVDGLDELLFHPDRAGVREDGWPTMAELAADGKQLLVFSDRTRAQDAPSGTVRDDFGVMYQREWTVENHWSMGPGVGTSDWSCYSRWYGSGVNVPLTREEAGFTPLFVMNHFRDVPITGTAASDNAKLLNRAENFCAPAARKKPNYVAVDHYDLGQARDGVDRLNAYVNVP